MDSVLQLLYIVKTRYNFTTSSYTELIGKRARIAGVFSFLNIYLGCVCVYLPAIYPRVGRGWGEEKSYSLALWRLGTINRILVSLL
jgi:hypothetical protein